MKLTRFETRWAEAEMGVIFPGSSDEGLADIGKLGVGAFLQEVMGAVPFKAALGLRLAIWLVALAPLFLLGRLATITGLRLPDRETVVNRLVASRSYAVRSLVLILKTMGALLYAGDVSVRARMNLPPPRRPSLVPLRVKRVHAA
ncbi:MAG TPA: hypothetical protein VIF15_20510 [Polyangiaceae bacterium]|jgi:hypothetical protein